MIISCHGYKVDHSLRTAAKCREREAFSTTNRPLITRHVSLSICVYACRQHAPFCCYVYRLGDVQVGDSPGAVRGGGLAASDISDEGGEGGMGTGGEMPSSDCHVGPMLSSCTDN